MSRRPGWPSLLVPAIACALMTTCTPTLAAADGASRTSVRLHSPYPITGPREIQASDRSTRSYRALAARTAPPVTETMADMVAAALWSGADLAIIRSRRDDLLALAALDDTTIETRDAAPDLLLAGDDLLRAFGAQPSPGASRPPPAVVEPIAGMPLVLVCATAQCRAFRAQVGAASKSVPFPLRFGSLGTTGALGGSGAAARAWISFTGQQHLRVPYAGGNGMVTDLVAGRIDAAFVALPLALGYLEHDKLRAIGISAPTRFPRLPDLPTLAEAGVPVVVEGWFAVFASKRLPPSVSARARIAISAYRSEEAARMELLARGLVPATASAAQFERRIAAELAAWRTELRRDSDR